MEEEKTNHGYNLRKRRLVRSASPDFEMVAKKRFLDRQCDEQEYATVTISTPYHAIHQPPTTEMKLQPKSTQKISDLHYVLNLHDIDFNTEYNKLDQITIEK